MPNYLSRDRTNVLQELGSKSLCPVKPFYLGGLRLRQGSLLVEVLIAISLFSLFATASFLTLLTGQESSRTGSARVRGVYYTEQALEVGKSIRDSGWSDIATGRHGFTLSETGSWVFTGTSLSRYGYRTYVLVTSKDANTKRVTTRSSWKLGRFRSGATVLSMEISNWRTNDGIGDWSDITQQGSVTFPTQLNFNDITVYKDYAYVTSEVGTAGDGLYIFDVSNPASPSRVSSSFSLPATAHKPAFYFNRLYVGVEEVSGDDIHAYNISNPTSLNGSTTTMATYDLPGGDGRALSLAVRKPYLFVGAKSDASEDEFYVFNLSTGSELNLVDSINLDSNPNVYDVFVRDDYAYLATDHSTAELIVLDISDPSSVVTHSLFNAANSQDGNGARAFGTGFYIARATGAANEFFLVTGSGGVPKASDSYGANIGGNVNAMDMDPLGCYAFLATSNTTEELQIRNGRHKTVDEESTDNLTTGEARGIHYDLLEDRLYLATESGFYIYVPGSNGTCQ